MAEYQSQILQLRALRADLTDTKIAEEIQQLGRTTIYSVMHHLGRSIRLATEGRPMQWEPAGSKREEDMRRLEAVEDFARR